MKNHLLAHIAFALLSLCAFSHANSEPIHFDSAQCQADVTDPNVDNIVREVFENKTKRLAEWTCPRRWATWSEKISVFEAQAKHACPGTLASSIGVF